MDNSKLDELFLEDEQRLPGWQAITLRLPSSSGEPLIFSIAQGNGGRPDQRAQLTLNPATGAVIRWEPFSSYNLGRRLRGWGRFVHTGEAGGVFGQTVAAAVSAAAMVLVWTGIALALRLLRKWRNDQSAKLRQEEKMNV